MNNIFQPFFSSPLFSRLMPCFELFGAREQLPDTAMLNHVLNVDKLRFVAQGEAPARFEDHYEPRIFLRREVQTRENSWHDFFNALIWFQFTKTKNAINRIHFEQQQRRYPVKLRSPAENMLTIFDEHGAMVFSPNAELLDLIRTRQWHELFWRRREETEQQVTVVIFGHGLYEKMLTPYIGLTTHCLLFHHDDEKATDEVAADFLLHKNSSLTTKDLCPLPLLGMPGLWPDNVDENFYGNTNYFRPLTR